MANETAQEIIDAAWRARAQQLEWGLDDLCYRALKAISEEMEDAVDAGRAPHNRFMSFVVFFLIASADLLPKAEADVCVAYAAALTVTTPAEMQELIEKNRQKHKYTGPVVYTETSAKHLLRLGDGVELMAEACRIYSKALQHKPRGPKA